VSPVTGPAIVVAFRMPPGGLRAGPDGTYLERARALCSRAEALGARLIAWSAATLAVAWDPDSIEEAISLAVGARDGAAQSGGAWACGVAEGTLEAFDAGGGGRVALSWGEALTLAVALARAAHSGEVLVDGDVRAIRAGQLAVDGIRSGTDAGQRTRGWRLNLDRPWRDVDADRRAGMFDDEVSTSDILRIVDAAAEEPGEDVEASADTLRPPPPPGPAFGARIRDAVESGAIAGAVELLPDLRRAASPSGGPAGGRARFELAVALCLAGRRDDALLEALDALARARETGDAALGPVCLALVAKLYTQAGWPDAARRLAELARAPVSRGS
jgi:hypothetical protein